MTDLTPPDPARFNMTSFADLLRRRAPIIGEDPGSFKGFHAGMMQSLHPMTPYEGVIAENLIAIEWELLQHRRMRDAGLRKVVRMTKRQYLSGLFLLKRLGRVIAHETAHDGKRHKLLRRYLREARSQRRKAFAAWLACLREEPPQVRKAA